MQFAESSPIGREKEQEFCGSQRRSCIGQSHWNAKSRSRAPDHSACLKKMLTTITVQGLILAAITSTEKCTLMLDLT